MKWVQLYSPVGIPVVGESFIAGDVQIIQLKYSWRLRRIIFSARITKGVVSYVPDVELGMCQCDKTGAHLIPLFENSSDVQLVGPLNWAPALDYTFFRSKDGGIDVDLPCGPYVSEALQIKPTAFLTAPAAGGETVYWDMSLGFTTNSNL